MKWFARPRELEPTKAWILAGVAMLAFAFLHTPAFYPLRILVVFFHELSHAIATWLTGGSVVEIALNAQEGGHTLSQGGNRFIELSAGYLGSLLFGGAIVLFASRVGRPRLGTAILAVILGVVTIGWMRPYGSFGFVFALILAGVLGVCALKLSRAWNEGVLLTVGVTSCLYAVFDIKSDVLERPQLLSDAAMLAQETGIPTMIWGFLWIAIALVGTWVFASVSCRK